MSGKNFGKNKLNLKLPPGSIDCCDSSTNDSQNEYVFKKIFL